MTQLPRFGVLYPDGRFSGPISPSRRYASAYAKPFRGTVYEVGSPDDPELHTKLPVGEPWFPSEAAK